MNSLRGSWSPWATFCATLLDVTITAKRALEAVGRDHGVEVRIYLLAYADDVSAIIIRYTEAELYNLELML